MRHRLPVQRTASAYPVPVVDPPLRRARSLAPPTRRRVAGAPRVVARAACVVRQPRLPVRWMLAVAGVVCLAVVGLGMLSGAGASSVPDRTTVVRVQSGESLWELAGRVAPGSDPSAVVDRIRELNGGLTGGVRPGQPLNVPTAG
ncbi:LysM peptidoglycan-binding domain-containing protein [Actinophytocola sp.]|uniref:LysM peptidoglycan-binding domain-containing protein n=1 Tax=Actinophytocola sp. TaxID=1872138 RepID=UPI0025C4AD3A|nr:LysM peptidoglycan-binding domain-containing protein [Actinophytocola sp.]